MTNEGLADFLLARIAEREEMALRVLPYLRDNGSRIEVHLSRTETQPDGSQRGTSETVAPYDPARVLAECEALRQIAERWQEVERAVEAGIYRPDVPIGYRAACRLMGTAYADHPDYRDEWRA